MEAIGLLVTLEARAGKEADAEIFLKSAQPLAQDEKGTLKWYVIKLGPGKFGIFDTFANEADRNAHLTNASGRSIRYCGPRTSLEPRTTGIDQFEAEQVELDRIGGCMNFAGLIPRQLPRSRFYRS